MPEYTQIITSQLLATVDIDNYAVGEHGSLYVNNGCSATNTTVLDGGEMYVFNDGYAGFTTIESGGKLNVMNNAVAASNTVNGGSVQINGTATDNVVFGGEMKVMGGEIDGTSIMGGSLVILADGKANGTVVEEGGVMNVTNGSATENYVYTGGTLNISGGEASDIHVGASAALVVYAGAASGVETDECTGEDTCAVTVYGGSLEDAAINANGTLLVLGGTVTGVTVGSGGSIVASTHKEYNNEGDLVVVGGSIGDITVLAGGTLILCDSATLTGAVSVADGASLDFVVTGRKTEDQSIVNDYSLIANASNATHTITVDAEQATGTYRLADNANAFSASFTLKTSEEILGTLTLEDSLCSEKTGALYSLAVGDDGGLSLTVTANTPVLFTAFEDSERRLLSIQSPLDSSVLAISDGEGRFEMDISAVVVRVWNLPEGEYSLSLSGCANTLEHTATDNGIHHLLSDSNDGQDVFFAKAESKWTGKYVARHEGSLEAGWTGTGMSVSLAGKNRICDLFSGSDAPSALYLTDSSNGDALFIDDIYSALPEGTEQQARISNIDTIYGGAGDDVIDMTSQRFRCSGDGMDIHGGDGDDVIWAGCYGNRLFGDGGDDSIVGGAGDDVLVGGDGNDTLNGGGGSDIFCFCKNWGNDIVTQLSSGAVTLWFAEGDASKWNASTKTYTDGGNSVVVDCNSEVTLLFGDNNGDARYASLSSIGAFIASTSDRIFSDGTLA